MSFCQSSFHILHELYAQADKQSLEKPKNTFRTFTLLLCPCEIKGQHLRTETINKVMGRVCQIDNDALAMMSVSKSFNKISSLSSLFSSMHQWNHWWIHPLQLVLEPSLFAWIRWRVGFPELWSCPCCGIAVLVLASSFRDHQNNHYVKQCSILGLVSLIILTDFRCEQKWQNWRQIDFPARFIKMQLIQISCKDVK